jgi:hypothetical protein
MDANLTKLKKIAYENEISLPLNHFISNVAVLTFRDSPPRPKMNLPKIISQTFIIEKPKAKIN